MFGSPNHIVWRDPQTATSAFGPVPPEIFKYENARLEQVQFLVIKLNWPGQSLTGLKISSRLKDLLPIASRLPVKVVLTKQLSFSRETLVCQCAFAVMTLDAFDVPDAIQNLE